MGLCSNGFVAEGSCKPARRARHAGDASKPLRRRTTKEQPAVRRTLALRYLSGMGVARSMGTAVTLFLGEPSISRSE